MSTAKIPNIEATATGRDLGYQIFSIGKFQFERDEYFAHISFPHGRHIMPVDSFLRALMRDVAWGFFYGTVNFDHVFGTTNRYGTVEMFAGAYNEAYRKAGLDQLETFKSDELMKTFKAMVADWTNQG